MRAANLALSLFSVLETNIKSYVFMRKIYSWKHNASMLCRCGKIYKDIKC